MATQVEMPKMGYDMTEGTILAWHKHEGDTVHKGDALGEIETGKVNIEIEAFDGGVLRKILVPEGQTVPVGTPIAIIAGADEVIDLPAAAPVVGAGVQAGPGADDGAGIGAGSQTVRGADSGPEHKPALPGPSGAVEPDGRVSASPLARRLARERGIALAAVAGTGPSGRITRDDVLAAAEAGATAPAVPVAVPPLAPDMPTPVPVAGAPAQAMAADTREALSGIRRTIARRLTESWTAAPHIFLTMPIRMDAALALRNDINAALEASGGKVSVNDLVVKAAARALRAHPRLNVSWDDGARMVHGRVNVGVAVALDDGLMTVTIADADSRPLSAIAAEVADKATRARSGKLTAEDLNTPSTFTISNLGMYGIEDFTAIINPPEAAILAVGAAAPAAVVEDGAVVVRTIMKVTLSADHRVVDGATAAEYLVTLRGLLEKPLGMLL